MKLLRLFIVFVLLLFLNLSCSSIPLFKKGATRKSTPEPPVTYTTDTSHELTETYYPLLLAIAAVFFILFLYRSSRATRLRKHIKLDDEDMAMLGLTADTLGDLWHRIRNKTKSKIIPFHRGN